MMTQMTDLILAQLDSLAEDDDRSADERRLLKIHLLELKSEFSRLSKIEVAASRIAQQTSAEDAMPNLEPVILWLENGCDPKEAVKELRHYQKRMRSNNGIEGRD